MKEIKRKKPKYFTEILDWVPSVRIRLCHVRKRDLIVLFFSKKYSWIPTDDASPSQISVIYLKKTYDTPRNQNKKKTFLCLCLEFVLVKV